jgi:ribonuclease P/MRP protein subunit POP5
VKYFSPVTSTGILRVSRDHVRIVWAALSYIAQIDSRRTVIRMARVSGTMKKCEKGAIKRNKSQMSNQVSAIARFEEPSEHESDNVEEE